MADTPDKNQLKAPPIHKLGWKSRDLAELRREHAEKLDRIIAGMLDRFETEMDSIPVRMLAVPIGILIDKRLAMDQGPATNTTTNNTVVINGISRADAMAFLNGSQAGNGFSHGRDAISTVPTVDLDATSSGPNPLRLSSKTPE